MAGAVTEHDSQRQGCGRHDHSGKEQDSGARADWSMGWACRTQALIRLAILAIQFYDVANGLSGHTELDLHVQLTTLHRDEKACCPSNLPHQYRVHPAAAQ